MFFCQESDQEKGKYDLNRGPVSDLGSGSGLDSLLSSSDAPTLHINCGAII